MSCERRLQLRNVLGHHEPVALAVVRELALQVQKVGTWNVCLTKGSEARLRNVWFVNTRRRWVVIRRAVKDAQIRLTEKRGERFGGDDGVWVAHWCQLPYVIR